MKLKVPYFRLRKSTNSFTEATVHIMSDYSFKNEDSITTTLNGDIYSTMTTDYFVPALHGINVNDV